MKFTSTILILTFFAILMSTPEKIRAQDTLKPLIKFKTSPSFGLPLDCKLGEDCWVMNYVDFTPDDGKNTDPQCLNRTYDTHKGTDFAIADEKAMKNGVDVIAAMDGTVERIRDGEPDNWATDDDLKAIKAARKECGNAALITHQDGLQTIYCHMKNGSIAVKPGKKIQKGDKIGEVGLSGLTQFPHLHFGIIWEGAIIDPFTGQNNTGQCNKQKRVLWDKDLVLEYQPLIIQNIGFTDQVPNLETIEKDSVSQKNISMEADALAFWVTLLGTREGDKITIKIHDPNGKIFASREIEQPKTRARQFYFAGRKTTNIKLKEGAYTGSVTITRPDKKGEPQEWSNTVAVLITP